MSATAPGKINAAQAAALKRAEDEVARTRAAAEKAERDRATIRARYRHLFPAAGGELQGGGFSVKVTRVQGRLTFSLSGFLQKHRLTKAMKPFTRQGDPYDLWTVKRIDPED